MPERRIQVTEYRCYRCSYQWISRTVNERYRKFQVGDDYKSVWNDEFYFEHKPKSCPRCKSHLWDRRYYSYRERGLIAKLTRENYLINFNKVGTGMLEGNTAYNMPLVLRRFISDIQPNLEELRKVVYLHCKDEIAADMKLGTDRAREKRQEIMLEILRVHGIIITPEDIEKDRLKQIENWEIDIPLVENALIDYYNKKYE